MGRPSLFTAELADEICERLSGGEPLAKICRDPHMPGLRTVYDWAERDSDLSARIARARDAGEDVIAADCMDIADDGRNDWMLRSGKEDAGWVANGEHIQRSKLRVETRLKLLAKWNPKRWSERTVLAGDPDAPLEHRHTAADFSDEELLAIAQRGRAAPAESEEGSG